MRDTLRPLGAEALGTFLLVFVSCSAVVLDQTTGALGLVGIAFAHGLALSVGVTAAMPISGGHLNPAVSIALAAARKIDAQTAGLYIVSQLAGGVIAVLLVRLLFPAAWGEVAVYGAPAIAPNVTFWGAVGIEAVLTFILVSAVFGTAVAPTAPKVGGFGIGLALTADVLVGGPLTGAAANPARAFAPELVSGSWVGGLVYWIGPVAGGLAAAAVWSLLLLERESD